MYKEIDDISRHYLMVHRVEVLLIANSLEKGRIKYRQTQAKVIKKVSNSCVFELIRQRVSGRHIYS